MQYCNNSKLTTNSKVKTRNKLGEMVAGTKTYKYASDKKSLLARRKSKDEGHQEMVQNDRYHKHVQQLTALSSAANEM
jgi:hypothetical protein